MNKKNFLSLLLTLLLLLPGSALPAYAEGADFGIYTESFLDMKKDSLGCVSYQDMVTNFFAKDPGNGEDWYIATMVQTREDVNYGIYRKALGEYLKTADITSATQKQKEYLIYLAAGGNREDASGVADETIGGMGMMSYIYGLHLLNNGAPSELHTPESVVDTILSLQKDEGGWAIMGDYADVDTTAMTIQALAPYYASDPEVKAAVDKAFDLMGSKQLESGAYYSFGSDNPEGTAQLLLALACVGIDGVKDERFIKNGNTLLDGIKQFRLDDGTYAHTLGGTSNGVTTQQVMYCTAGYRMMLEGRGSFLVFRTPVEPETDDSIGIDHSEAPAREPMGLKTWLYIAVAALGVIWTLVLVLRKKKKFNSYLSVILVCAAAVFLIHSIDIKSTDDYYNGTDEITGEAITCSLSIRCDTVAGRKDFIPKDGIILDTVDIKLPKGATAMDQMTAAARLYKIQLDMRGNFIAGINYIYEKDFGDLSGWMYRVNGEYASVGAPELVLNDGDIVEWLYTTDLGYDVGNDYMGK